MTDARHNLDFNDHIKPLPPGPFNVVYADPPWAFSDRIRSSKKDSVGRYQFYTPTTTPNVGRYSTMRPQDILSMPVGKITAPDCALFMWTTDAHLPLALDVMNAWGMPYKTIAFVWNKKERTGKQVCYFGKWTMKGTEICLLGAKGKAHSLIQSHRVRSLIEAVRRKHSQKPDEARTRIVDLMGDIPRIELFAREPHEGWTVWGNEVD